MREEIIEILKKSSKALSTIEIAEKLNMTSVNGIKNVIEVLSSLEKDFEVYRSNKDKYMLFENSHLKKGRLSVNKKGFGFLLLDNEDDIYIDSSMIDYQKKRYVHAIEQYETIYCPDKVAIFSAPGRSEVCGNHTDHQHGMVLATSINLDTIAVSAKNNNDVVRFVSDGYDMITLDINDL